MKFHGNKFFSKKENAAECSIIDILTRRYHEGRNLSVSNGRFRSK